MKKSIYYIIIACISIFIFSGCSKISEGDMGDKIIPPDNKSIPLSGTWKVVNYKPIKEDNKELEKYSGMVAQFSNDFASFGKELYLNPSYKVKYVNIDSYLSSQYKVSAGFLNIADGDGVVVQISSEDKSFYDFIKIDDENIVMYFGEGFVYLKKVSNETEKPVEGDISPNYSVKEKINNNLPESGILLGLKSTNPSEEISYRTLWIAWDSNGIRPVYERKNLLVPRMSGFWDLSVSRNYKHTNFEDEILAKPLYNSNKLSESNGDIKNNRKDQMESKVRQILFVGNDCVSIEESTKSQNNEIIGSRYLLLPIDNISYNKGIKISDILGKEVNHVFMNSGRRSIEDAYKTTFEETMLREDNFALERKNGSWTIIGRGTFQNKNIDFNANIVPSKKIVHYDDLYISWNTIKSKVPEAIDAYTSPNNKFALILTEQYIYIYEIKNGVLDLSPIEKISLNSKEKVVMSEWATGYFVYKWEDYVRANNAKQLKENK